MRCCFVVAARAISGEGRTRRLLTMKTDRSLLSQGAVAYEEIGVCVMFWTALRGCGPPRRSGTKDLSESRVPVVLWAPEKGPGGRF